MSRKSIVAVAVSKTSESASCVRDAEPVVYSDNDRLDGEAGCRQRATCRFKVGELYYLIFPVNEKKPPFATARRSNAPSNPEIVWQ